MSIRVLLVDDSAIVRGLIARGITEDKQIEVVGTAANGEAAVALVADRKPDIIVLDIEMPVMDGMTALPLLLKASPGSRVIMASTLTQRNAAISLEALEKGASDYIAKPAAKEPGQQAEFYRDLREKIKALAPSAPSAPPTIDEAHTPVKPAPAPAVITLTRPAFHPVRALAIASSTGGPQALLGLFEAVKGRLGHIPIFITQHMPPTFTTLLAEHLTRISGRECAEGRDGEVAEAGRAYLAPGDFHMAPEKQGQQVIIRLNQNPPENFCRPAADPMLRALSGIYGTGLLTVVLTGMGHDGLEGGRRVVEAGGSIIAQDEATSVVWGMPRAVAEAGLCRAVLPARDIAPMVLKLCEAG